MIDRVTLGLKEPQDRRGQIGRIFDKEQAHGPLIAARSARDERFPRGFRAARLQAGRKVRVRSPAAVPAAGPAETGDGRALRTRERRFVATPMTFTGFRRLWRPTLPHAALNAIVASYVLAVLNSGFWSRLLAVFPGEFLRPAIFAAGVWCLTVLLLELLGPGRLQKPVAAVLILIAASAHYYERSFGVLIDREMVRNIFETTPAESRHLITFEALRDIALTGVLPAALVFWPRVRRVGRWHHLWRWPAGVALCFAVMAGALFSHYKDYASLLRQRHDLLGAYQPGASLVAGVRYAREQWKTADPVAAPVGTDARTGQRLASATKPVLLVLFVGETARAQNFGLDGYGRDTTPELSRRDVINFAQTTSCGTSTAVSVPCMFSPLTKAGYSRAAVLGHENLLDVLGHAGIRTEWWDNNTGDQGVALRTGWNRIDQTLAPEACVQECTDEAFLPVIDRTLATIETDTVLVLHMIGSHGPSYYLRYPEARAAFQPACRTPQFSDCAREEIVNAYDNSLRETDWVVAQAIDRLSASDRVLPALIFLSDHGESLGENGLYLHAAPAFMAPEEQTHVPFVLWMGSGFATTMGLSPDCLRRVAQRPASHDNLFPTVLGLMDVSTEARSNDLDLTSACRTTEAM